MDLGLEDRICVVTGASRGIGRATAERLSAEGARVLLVARTEEEVSAAAAACGERAEWIACDVTDPQADTEIVAEAVEQMGGIDVLVNNAGTSYPRSIDELTDEDWLGQYALHVLAPMRLMRAAAPRMAAAGGGRIVNVASSAGKRPSLMNPAYSVTKAAQLSLSRVFADLYAGQGVLVNAVTPGATASELWMGEGGMADQIAARAGIEREQALERQLAKIPLGRFAQPSEIADVIAFLCSQRAGAVTGAAWSADGGSVQVII
jgi:3-oxoacyl-[acyl-carrier protein] reductase